MNEGVQANTPVVALNDAPAGRFVALYVIGSPSASVALTVKLSGEPSAMLLLPIGASTGGRFVFVTVMAIVPVASPPRPSFAWKTTPG